MIISLSIGEPLLRRFDTVLEQRGYSSRSEGLRDALREFLDEKELELGGGENMVVVSVLYEKTILTERDVSAAVHGFESVQTMLHVHTDETNCLEIYVIRAKGRDVLSFVRDLKKIRNVKHVRFVSAVCDV